MKNNYCDVQDNCEVVNQLKEQLVAKEKEGKEKSWEIGNLGYKIKNQRKEINKLQEQVNKLKTELEPFQDEYFKGLDNVTIAELAKKSIRITAENCKLEQALIEIKEIAESNCNLCLSIDGYKKPDDCGICEFARILQKISEVEDEK